MVLYMPSLFVKDTRGNITREVTPGCEWVLQGEGVARRKYDGVCCELDTAGKWWYCYKDTVGSIHKIPAYTSEITFMFTDAIMAHGDTVWEPGTYELCGPDIKNNPEKLERHELLSHRHASVILIAKYELNFTGMFKMMKFMRRRGAEGIVWTHPDGRIAKLEVRDFPLLMEIKPDAQVMADVQAARESVRDRKIQKKQMENVFLDDVQWLNVLADHFDLVDNGPLAARLKIIADKLAQLDAKHEEIVADPRAGALTLHARGATQPSAELAQVLALVYVGDQIKRLTDNLI